MLDVTIVGHSDGDGYLQVDTGEWFAERGDYDDELTEDLRDWLEVNGHRWADGDAIGAWVKARTGEPPCGLYGEDGPLSVNLYQAENILTDWPGYLILTAGGELGQLVIVNAAEAGLYTTPTVYRSHATDQAEWLDYASASGACPNGHEWTTDDACRMFRNEDGRSDSARITDRVRVPSGDSDRAYLACLACGEAVTFLA